MAERADAGFTIDLYERLGLSPGASAQVIRKQFRLLARLYHPDYTPNPEFHERFLGLEAAYTILSDPERRGRYDRWLAERPVGERPLTIETRLGPASLGAGIGRQRLYLLVTLVARSIPENDGPPLNLMLVLDRSSSMRGERLRQVRLATQAIARQLGPNDRFGVVSFADRAQVVLPLGRGVSPEVVRSAVEALEAAGGTEIASGLELGLSQMLAYAGGDALSHLILLTDGHTYGDEAHILNLADLARKARIGITVFGVGESWNDAFLDALAARAGGSVHHIAEPDEAIQAFKYHVRRLQTTIIHDATLGFVPGGPEVNIHVVHEVAPDLKQLDTRAGAIPAGSLSAGRPRSFLLDLVVDPGEHNLLLAGHLSCNGKVRAGEEWPGVEQPVVVTVEPDAGEMPAEIVAAARRATAARLQERAWQMLAAGDGVSAHRDLTRLMTHLIAMGEVDLARTIERELPALTTTGRLSPQGSKLIKYGTRRLGLPPVDEER